MSNGHDAIDEWIAQSEGTSQKFEKGGKVSEGKGADTSTGTDTSTREKGHVEESAKVGAQLKRAWENFSKDNPKVAAGLKTGAETLTGATIGGIATRSILRLSKKKKEAEKKRKLKESI